MTEIGDIKEILKIHEKRIVVLEKLIKKLKPVFNSLDSEKVILNLIDSGFFDSQKKYGEVIEDLKKQAKFEKKTNYKKILAKLTRENKLERKSSHKQWLYSKKQK